MQPPQSWPKMVVEKAKKFSDDEWAKLEKLAAEKGRRYASAKKFLQDIKDFLDLKRYKGQEKEAVSFEEYLTR